jgi:hypothetical protein
LTGDQALDVLQRLAARKGTVADAILAEAEHVLAAVDVDEIAKEVFDPRHHFDTDSGCNN